MVIFLVYPKNINEINAFLLTIPLSIAITSWYPVLFHHIHNYWILSHLSYSYIQFFDILSRLSNEAIGYNGFLSPIFKTIMILLDVISLHPLLIHYEKR